MEKLKIAVCGACLLVVAILGYCYVSKKQNEKYEHIINSAISNIVDTVIEKYPDVGEEEIFQDHLKVIRALKPDHLIVVPGRNSVEIAEKYYNQYTKKIWLFK